MPDVPLDCTPRPSYDGPVIVVHIASGAGLTACSGYPWVMPPADWYPNTPRWLCPGCRVAALSRLVAP